MSLNQFIPTVWAAEIIKNLNNIHVFPNCVNRDFEGEISAVGDSVKIHTIGRVTISDYTKNVDLASPEHLNGAELTLTIDTAKSFNFAIDDIDKAQQKPKLMPGYTEEASWGMADKIDLYLAALIQNGVATANQLTAGSVGTGAGDTDAYETLVDLDVKLSENNIPRPGRWAVVPFWYEGMLRKDPRFTGYSTPASQPRLMGMPIGNASGFEIYTSNNVTIDSDGVTYNVLAGHKMAVTFADSLREIVAYRPEKQFSDALKGLHLWGGKVTRPQGLAAIKVTKADR